MNRETIQGVISALDAKKMPSITVDDVPAFSESATAGNEHLSLASLEYIVSHLTKADIPTFERALRAIDENDLAWLGFKVVYDAAKAIKNVDNEVTKKFGDQGSADGEPLVFFCNDAKEIVSSRVPSPRDVFQMQDITRGSSMHNEQFDGLTWVSVALFRPTRVWLLGASDVACELAKLAYHVGFQVMVVDYDSTYLTETRFPYAERILLDCDDFEGLFNLKAHSFDYVCVLTRGHMFDPECCVWSLQNDVHYIGMMGRVGKNDTVHDLVVAKGVTEEQWSRIKRPIGLEFGAKTPAELAIAIVAELIDVRYQERYSQEARDLHEKSLGRV